MATSDTTPGTAKFRVENIGGINETTVEIPSGVTVLSGENATNRTSFLQAIMAAMGSTQATVKGNATEGTVHLEMSDETVDRTLSRDDGHTTYTGDQYIEDPSTADLFAFLLESNEARRAVARGDDLRELIMRPVDADEIKREIERLTAEKGEINDELADIESRKTDLPAHEEERTRVRAAIEDKREELADLEDDIDSHRHTVDESREEQAALESKLSELRSTRADLDTARRNIETQTETITALTNEQRELEEELGDLPDTPMGDHTELEDEIERLRTQRQVLNTEISDLQSIIQYNEEQLEGDTQQLVGTLVADGDAASSSAVTDQLLPEDEETVICWTCGSSVDREQILETVDRLRDVRSERISQLNDIEDRLDSVKAERSAAREQQRRRDRIQEQLDDIDDEIEQRETRLESLRSRRTELTETVEDLETAVNELETDDFEEILSLHKEANQIEFEIDRLETDIDEVTEEIETIESQLERAADLREQRETILDELTDQRTKIGQIEERAIGEFNEHMAAILEILGYENLERIWIERVEQTVREGRSTVERATFDLHIVRRTENGTAYEDAVEHLSESEREVTGLVFALAGYLVHDLHETVPFMVLDSLEAIDSTRIASLVEYFADYATYLVVALLEEDARALADEYHYIESI